MVGAEGGKDVAIVNHSKTASSVKRTLMHLIDTTGPGGAETVFLTLLREAERSSTQHVVVLRGEGWLAEKVRSLGFEPRIVDSKGSFNIAYIRALKKIVRAEKVDLIHAHLLGSNVYGALLGLICRKPMIATFHGAVDVAENERFLKAKFLLISQGASKIVCVSERLKKELAARSSLSSKKLKLIHNGVAPSPAQCLGGRGVRKELGLSDTAILVVSIGNIRPAKGYEYLVSAAAALAKTDPDIHFVVVGHQKAALFRQLEAQVAEAGDPPQLHWLGFREDVAGILGEADIFLLPSVSEGFSISTVEAMMAGVPVIATRSGGPEELIADGKTGMLIPTRSPQAIVEAVSKLKDPEVRHWLRDNAREEALRRFSLSSMLDEYNGLYHQLI